MRVNGTSINVGREPVLPWLWAQHNEHRLPLPRAVFLTMFRVTHDFRTGMNLQVAMLSALIRASASTM